MSVIYMMLSFASCLASDSLSTPEDFVASAGDTIVTLTWGPVQENTTYTLYWSLTSGTGTGGTKVPSVVSPYVHMGLTNGTQYYYVLTASNDSGTSSPTREVSATPNSLSTPTPEDFVASAGDTIVTLTWGSVQENTTHTLYWSLTSGTGTKGTKFPSSVVSPYTHTGLTNGTQYYYVLTASNDSGTSSPTREVSAIPNKVISSAPANFMGASGHTTSGQAFFSSVGGKTYVYFKNFSTDNGPRLHVYLSSASNNINDAVDLGDLTNPTGDQNYEIPSGTDLSRYNKVLIWCVPYSILFGFANLNALPN